MLVVIALGGNALLQRGEPLEAKLQLENVKLTAKAIAELAKEHQVVVCHGNGPQVGLLALQNLAYTKVNPYPLDVLVAESQGMIGYMIQQELKNELPTKDVVTLITQIEVAKNDPAFTTPSKPIGPVYNKEEAETLQAKYDWDIAADGQHWRRVVPSPQPQNIVELHLAESLLKNGATVIFGGGGGVPVIKNSDGTLTGVEAVIDKDNTASLIAEKLGADAFVILTDVEAVCTDWGTPQQQCLSELSLAQIKASSFAKGSMGPKVTGAARFVEHTGRFAAIGKLSQLKNILEGKAGTRIVS